MPIDPHIKISACVLIIVSFIMALDSGWGFVELYIASYLHRYNQSITTSSVHILYSILQISQLLGAQIFRPICIKLGYREGISICFLFQSSGLFMCYFTTSIYGFIIPVIFFGTATGLRTLVNSFLMIALLPNNFGFAAGLGNAGGAFSIVYWSYLSLSILNPHNKHPTIIVQEGERTLRYFDSEITNQVPNFFVIAGIIALIAGIFQPLQVKNPPNQKSLIENLFTKILGKKKNQ